MGWTDACVRLPAFDLGVGAGLQPIASIDPIDCGLGRDFELWLDAPHLVGQQRLIGYATPSHRTSHTGLGVSIIMTLAHEEAEAMNGDGRPPQPPPPINVGGADGGSQSQLALDKIARRKLKKLRRKIRKYV